MSGQDFGPYRLVELLGRGGMGEVWRAVDTRKDRTVAVKIIGSWAQGDDVVRRFRREAAMVARLSAPNIVGVHDYGEIDGRLYIEMPFVHGVDLRTVLADGPLPAIRAASILGQVADALDAAHDAGLVHRDVKPSNVMVTGPWMGRDFVYLIDFGIARDDNGTTSTAAGGVLGTPAYMAPERFGGPGDRRSDVYSLACLLFEMLSGHPPFVPPDGAHALGYLYDAHRSSEPPRLGGDGSAAVDDVLRRGLAKHPADRHLTAGELAAAAAAALAGGSGEPPPHHSPAAPTVSGRRRSPAGAGSVDAARSGPTSGTPASGRRRRWVATAAVTAVLLGGGAGWFVLGNRTSAADPPMATAGAPVPVRPARVLETLTADDGVSGVAITPDGRRAYAANLNSGSVSEIDLSSGRSTRVNPETNSPFDLAVSPDSRSLWVVDVNSGRVVVLDTASRDVVRRIVVEPEAGAIAFSSDGRRAYITEADSSTVAVIDAATGAVLAHVPVGGSPAALAVTPDGRRLVVAASGSDAVSVVDTEALRTVATTPVERTPVGLALSPDGRWAYAANRNSDSVSVVDLAGAEPVRRITVPSYPSSVVTSPDGRLLFVSSGLVDEAQQVTVVDPVSGMTRQTVRGVGAGNGGELAITPDGSRLLLTEFFAGTVTMFDPGVR